MRLSGIHVPGGRELTGIFGDPVGHSKSPAMHNAAFRALGLSWVYLKFRVPPNRLKQALAQASALGFRGLNITIPLKQEALPLVDTLTPQARRIGAVNTITFRRGGMEGHNTDGEGFIRSLREDLEVRPEGQRVIILGAGGAARAVTFALADAGVKSIVVLDSIPGKARCLAGDLRRITRVRAEGLITGKGVDWGGIIAGAGLLVNATPVGMHGRHCPLPPPVLRRPLAVADLVYNPPVTELIRQARRRGLKAMNGSGMLVLQGALSFERWTHRRAPVAVMRRALLNAFKVKR